MLFSLPQDSLKHLTKVATQLPLLGNILSKTILGLQGNVIAFFVIKEIDNLEKKLKKINKILSFISFKEALDILSGKKISNKNYSVLIYEFPDDNTIKSLKALINKLHIPLTIVIDNNFILNKDLSWILKISLYIEHSKEKNLVLDFFDRPLSLNTPYEKKIATQYLIENLSHCSKELLESRILSIKKYTNAKIRSKYCSKNLITKLEKHSLFSFITAGEGRWPFFGMSDEEIKLDLNMGKNFLEKLCPNNHLPFYWFSYPVLPDEQTRLIKLFEEIGYLGACHNILGFSRAGDNLFTLPRLPLDEGLEILNEQGILNMVKEIKELI